ncbi:MAG: hypothetical protein ACM3RX_03350, partial [Methanococcaceae archaeon]
LLSKEKLTILSYPDFIPDYSIIPSEFSKIEDLKQFKVDDTIEIGLSAASSLISQINKEHNLDTRKYKYEINRELKSSYYLYNTFSKYILPAIKPDIVYIFNGRFSTSWPLVSLCKKTNLTFFTHDRAGQMGKYILVKNTIPHDFDYFIEEMDKSWNDGNAENIQIGSKFFIERRNRITQGWYSYTTHQKYNALPKSFSKFKKNITIFNSTIEEYAAVKGWERFLYIFDSEIVAVRSILTYFREDKSKQFYLRVHPNLKGFVNTQTSEIRLVSKEFDNIEVIHPESEIDTYALIDNSDIIIVLGSTVGIESVFWKKPVIQLALSPYNHLDAVYIPDSAEQLYHMIESDLQPKEQLGAIKYGYWEKTRGERFRFFVQENIFAGKFLNKKIQHSVFKFLFYRIIEIRSLSEVKRVILRYFSRISPFLASMKRKIRFVNSSAN